MVDHLLVALFVVVHPVVGAFTYRRFRRRLKEGRGSRTALYRRSIIGQWVLALLALVIWSLAGRDWATLGFGLELGPGFWLGGLFALAVVALFYNMLRALRAADPETLAAYRAQVGRLEALLPHDESERRVFTLLSLTAGFVEELLWRGFLVWYLQQYTTTAVAAVAATVAFCIAHGYQGPKNAMKAGALGAVLMGLYLVTGSLWVPIFLHAAIDLLQGRMAHAVLGRSG